MIRKRQLLNLLLGIILVLAFSNDGFADRRSYVWTYEYMTMPKGKWEAEYYFTSSIPDMSKSEINTLKHYLELEYGITDHWDLAMYQRLKFQNKAAESDGGYDGFKIRSRYRFGEKGQFIVDPLVYLEYIRDEDFDQPNVIEGKLILAKDFSDLNLSYNQIFKRDLESRGKTEHEYAAGIGYRLSPSFNLALEAKGNYSEEKYYLGPTLAFFAKKFFISGGAAYGLNDASDDLQARVIVGVPF